MANPVIEFGYKHRHLAATATVWSGPGMLHTITINRPDTTAGATITVYDGVDATGTLIAVITMDQAVFVIPTTLEYDVRSSVGIHIVFSHAVTADITVSYN